MVVALCEWDADAYSRVLAELDDCPHCLRNVMNAVINLYTNDLVLRTGSLQAAADVAASELQRWVMRDA